MHINICLLIHCLFDICNLLHCYLIFLLNPICTKNSSQKTLIIKVFEANSAASLNCTFFSDFNPALWNSFLSKLLRLFQIPSKCLRPLIYNSVCFSAGSTKESRNSDLQSLMIIESVSRKNDPQRVVGQQHCCANITKVQVLLFCPKTKV